jgi:hypothetical protein
VKPALRREALDMVNTILAHADRHISGAELRDIVGLFNLLDVAHKRRRAAFEGTSAEEFVAANENARSCHLAFHAALGKLLPRPTRAVEEAVIEGAPPTKLEAPS